MSESQETQTSAPRVPQQTRGREDESAQPASTHRVEPSTPDRTGWVVFASMMMVLAGTFQVIAGLTALFRSGYYAVAETNLLISVDYTAWGWTHIGIGVLAFAAASGLLAGQMWARVVGIAMAVVSAVVNLAFLAAYPLGSLIIITLDVIVIYAIAVYGGEGKASDH